MRIWIDLSAPAHPVDFRPLVRGPTPLNLHALHQEESTNVRRGVEAAGFAFVTEGRFLRNDPRPNEWDAILAPNPTPLEEQDRFLLKFVKPALGAPVRR